MSAELTCSGALDGQQAPLARDAFEAVYPAHRDSTEVVSDQLAFAGVHACTDT